MTEVTEPEHRLRECWRCGADWCYECGKPEEPREDSVWLTVVWTCPDCGGRR